VKELMISRDEHMSLDANESMYELSQRFFKGVGEGKRLHKHFASLSFCHTQTLLSFLLKLFPSRA
jgi:hypothetical protein